MKQANTSATRMLMNMKNGKVRSAAEWEADGFPLEYEGLTEVVKDSEGRWRLAPSSVKQTPSQQLSALSEQQVLGWIEENTCYSELGKPTSGNLLYFAKTRGEANLTDDFDRRWKLLHREDGYSLTCID